MDGHAYDGPTGQTHRVAIPLDRQITVTVAIASPTGAPITDVYLSVNGEGGWGADGGVPTGNVIVIGHDAGLVRSGQSIGAVWRSTPLFGKRMGYLVLNYVVGNVGLDVAIANLVLT